jgi:hypothetical protein
VILSLPAGIGLQGQPGTLARLLRAVHGSEATVESDELEAWAAIVAAWPRVADAERRPAAPAEGECAWCQRVLPEPARTGRPRLYSSSRCRWEAHEARSRAAA